MDGMLLWLYTIIQKNQNNDKIFDRIGGLFFYYAKIGGAAWHMEGLELYHHGILGQKWGVRRYQNDDGTWTIAGKERRRKLRKWDPRRFQNKDGSLTEEGKERYMEAARRGKLNYKKLSNADLDMINTRFNKEKAYKRNVEEAMESLPSTKIKKAVLKIGEEAAKSALDALSKSTGGMGDVFKTAFTVSSGSRKDKGGGAEKQSQWNTVDDKYDYNVSLFDVSKKDTSKEKNKKPRQTLTPREARKRLDLDGKLLEDFDSVKTGSTKCKEAMDSIGGTPLSEWLAD